MTPDTRSAPSHAFDATAENFEAEVLQQSMQTPVLIDFWAEWCGPCKQLGPVLEKLAADYNGAFKLAKVDADKEQQLAAAFQVRSIPTVFLLKDGQPVDGFPGVLPEGQIREFLKQHGIEPSSALVTGNADIGNAPEAAAPVDPQAEVTRLRGEIDQAPDNDGLKLDLALALLQTGVIQEAEQLLKALPANLATDDRAQNAHARLAFAALLADAPPAETLRSTIQSNPDNLRARHLLGVRELIAGDAEAGLDQFLEMLQRDRTFEDGLPRKALIDAFRVVDDPALVSRYRRRMASLIF